MPVATHDEHLRQGDVCCWRLQRRGLLDRIVESGHRKGWLVLAFLGDRQLHVQLQLRNLLLVGEGIAQSLQALASLTFGDVMVSTKVLQAGNRDLVERELQRWA
ncbi:hypothetical protein D3C81_741990 [compost metagenome]